ADVHDRRAVGCFHVRDERHPPVDDHPPAAGAIEVADLSYPPGTHAVTAHLVSPSRVSLSQARGRDAQAASTAGRTVSATSPSSSIIRPRSGRRNSTRV